MAGHPEMEVDYNYIDSSNFVKLTISQTQEGKNIPRVFELSTNVELVNADGKRQIIPITINKRSQVFEFPAESKPLFVKLDANNDLLAEINQDITPQEACALFMYGENYLDRLEALEIVGSKSDSIYLDIIESALVDPFWNIRRKALLETSKLAVLRSESSFTKVKSLVKDENSKVRAAAFEALSNYYDQQIEIKDLEIGLHDSSFLVVSSALESIYYLDQKEGIKAAESLMNEENIDLILSLSILFADDGNPKYASYYQANALKLDQYARYSFIVAYGEYLEKQDDYIIKEHLNTLELLGSEDELWWNRLSVASNISRLKNKYAELNTLIKKQMIEETDQASIFKLEQKEKATSDILNGLQKILIRMRENETEPNVYRLLDSLID